MAELLACPFCGGRASIREGIHTKYVMCHVCDVMGPNLSRDDELIDQWNRRSTPASSPTVEDYERAISDFGGNDRFGSAAIGEWIMNQARAIARQREESDGSS
jgi:Lar family restriction alleviation protein